MTDTLTILCVGFGLLMTAISIRNWKFGVWGLLTFMPFAGLPTILMYPAPPTARLVKDVVFVLPAYVGFLAWYLRRRPRVGVPGALFWSASAVVLLAVAHLFGTSLLVGLVGLKTWALYLPLMVLGYHLVASTSELDRLVRWLLVVATIPIVIGILQAVLVYGGAPDLAYGFYGAAASEVTHGFGRTEVGTGDVSKVASTFTFVSQYYNFVLAMLCLAYGRWRSMPKKTASRLVFGLLPLTAVAIAALLTGARGAFVMVPLFFICASVLDGEWVGVVHVVALLSAGLTAALTLFKTTSQDLYTVVQDLAYDYLTVVQIGEFKQALATTLWGIGTGTNTGPARFIVSDPTSFVLENYYAKAVVEFGVPGLLVIVTLFIAILWLGWKARAATSDRVGKAYATGLVVFLFVSVVNEWKASYLDIDPLNVYFWLFIGLLLRIPTMTRAALPLRRPVPVTRPWSPALTRSVRVAGTTVARS